ncbi:MAG: sugar phosphate isomerase/epimerase [Planctomycetes bacterium]|nr:sugar phosphate isomerase/epimerase [Planctomycetota bacterium]
MLRYRLGTHTYIFSQFGYDHARQTDSIFEMVSRTGYPAIELHAPTFDGDDWLERITAAACKHRLRIVGGSHGLAMGDLAAYDTILKTMDVYSSKLARLGRRLSETAGGIPALMCGCSCGGKRFSQRTEAENQQVVRVWTELAQLFQSRGLVLNYHTHGEPIEDIRFILEHVPARLLPLGPDLDWLRVGGVEPQAFLREHADRLVQLHIRDYKLGGSRTEALGEGDANYRELARLLEEIGFAGECVVELAIPGKKCGRSLEELLRISRQHLRETMGL